MENELLALKLLIKNPHLGHKGGQSKKVELKGLVVRTQEIFVS